MRVGHHRVGTRCPACDESIRLGAFLSQLEEKPPCPAWAWEEDPLGEATLLHRCPACGAARLVTSSLVASLVVEWQLQRVLLSVCEVVRRGDDLN